MVYPCRVQYKLNGLRAEYEEQHFVTGDGVVWLDEVVQHILDPLKFTLKKMGLQDKSRPDGEFYRHGWALQTINKYIGVGNYHPRPETREIGFHLFDTNHEGSFDQIRWRMVLGIHDAVKRISNCPIHLVETAIVRNQQEADDFNKRAIDEGYEGIIYRLPHTPKGAKAQQFGLSCDFKEIDSGYVEGARPHWMLKRKDKFDAEFEIIDMTEGKMTDKGGKHVGRMGAVICVTKKFKREFHVGSGFSDKQRQEYWDNRNNPKKTIIGKMLRVEYGRLSEDGIPVEPRAFDGCIRNYA